MVFCVACGERTAVFEVWRTQLSKDRKPFSRCDLVCEVCLKAYEVWEQEGRILEMKRKRL